MPRSDSGGASGNQGVGNSRRPLERITKIHEKVGRGRYPDCSGITAEIEVTPKTIQRDITLMRYELQLPIEYDAVRPYTLSDVGGCWYLIGHDQSRDVVRTFAVPRIKALRVLSGRFVRPDDFDAATYLGESFGIWRSADGSGKSQRVRIRLEGWAARVAAERRWHPSQEIKKLKGKAEAIELHFELASAAD